MMMTAAPGCGGPKRSLVPPQVAVSPYDPAGGEALWAVAPPKNESGTSTVDAQAIGDDLVAAAGQVRGLRCLPLNRTIEAMRAAGIASIESPREAEAVATLLGVDGVLVSTVTAWDPYNPPVMGLTVALFTRPGRLLAPEDEGFDPLVFGLQATDFAYGPDSVKTPQPVNTAGGHFDAQGHDVLLAVKQYAEGRVEPGRPLGWEAYLASMDLYTEFVAHEAVRGLLGKEWLRLARTVAAAPEPVASGGEDGAAKK